jgi:hypothetical protein
MTGPAWSDQVDEGDWIAELLSEESARITSFVPRGYEAYARVLHPAAEPDFGSDRLVRWREVAEWSGTPLRNDAQFHSISLPAELPAAEPPDFGQGPREGSLYAPDAAVVAEIARRWTTTPDRCWFCVWDGYGWDNSVWLTERGAPEPPAIPDPIPESVRRGPRVHLPLQRNYFLYSGPVEAVAATYPLSRPAQSPNLWWPQDHAWCVATELDLQWTYVGGPSAMIGQLLSDHRIEALPADPDDPTSRIEEWVQALIDSAVDEVMASGTITITTSRGTVEASLVRPGTFRKGEFSTQSIQIDGKWSGGQRVPLKLQSEEDIRHQVSFYLTNDVLGLAGS